MSRGEKREATRVLFVEGDEDKRVIPHLAEAQGIPWGSKGAELVYNGPLLKHASDAIDAARRLGAPYSDAHRDKAQIHSWLAWQDPPGRQLHQAVMERMLHGKSPALERFIAWFRRLYDLPV